MKKNENTTKREFAYQCILRKIIDECLAPGTPLREDHLAEEFKISATPIREALRRLELEGWLQSFPNCGSFIRKFSADEIAELFFFREILEGAAAARAAENATAEDLEALRRLLDGNMAALAKYRLETGAKTLTVRSEYDLDFHEMLFAAAHAPLLYERYRVSQGQLKLLVMIGTDSPFPVEEMERVNEEHYMVYQAICRHWSDAAELLIRRHIATARQLTLASRQISVPPRRRSKKSNIKPDVFTPGR